jgi:hypothetical protein
MATGDRFKDYDLLHFAVSRHDERHPKHRVRRIYVAGHCGNPVAGVSREYCTPNDLNPAGRFEQFSTHYGFRSRDTGRTLSNSRTGVIAEARAIVY